MALLWLILIVILNSLSKYVVDRYLKHKLTMISRFVVTMTVLFQFVLVYLLIQSIMPYATYLLNLFYHQ
ncbi:Na+/proline symporter [Staphylococcus hominis]